MLGTTLLCVFYRMYTAHSLTDDHLVQYCNHPPPLHRNSIHEVGVLVVVEVNTCKCSSFSVLVVKGIGVHPMEHIYEQSVENVLTVMLPLALYALAYFSSCVLVFWLCLRLKRSKMCTCIQT